MQWPIVFLALSVVRGGYTRNSISSIHEHIVNETSDHVNGILKESTEFCNRDITHDYSKAITGFSHKLYTQLASRNHNHFVFSPYTIWLSLSALAEGADPSVQGKIFSSLNLPKEECIRQKFYDIALDEHPESDVILTRKRSLVLQEGVKVNPSWGNAMRSSGLLNYHHRLIKNDSIFEAVEFRDLHMPIGEISNSFLMDFLDYKGLWTTAFPDTGIVLDHPFFNEVGQKIGTVDMMYTWKQVRMANVPFLDAKVLELPVGTGGRYSMLIAVGSDNVMIKDDIQIFIGSILEIFSMMRISLFPYYIGVPRFTLHSNLDLLPMIDDIGVREFWRNPAATRYVSDPPAMPGAFIQHVTIKVESVGAQVSPPTDHDPLSLVLPQSEYRTKVRHEFIADRPFIFTLFDTVTYTCLYAGAFSKPDPLT